LSPHRHRDLLASASSPAAFVGGKLRRIETAGKKSLPLAWRHETRAASTEVICRLDRGLSAGWCFAELIPHRSGLGWYHAGDAAGCWRWALRRRCRSARAGTQQARREEAPDARGFCAEILEPCCSPSTAARQRHLSIAHWRRIAGSGVKPTTIIRARPGPMAGPVGREKTTSKSSQRKVQEAPRDRPRLRRSGRTQNTAGAGRPLTTRGRRAASSAPIRRGGQRRRKRGLRPSDRRYRKHPRRCAGGFKPGGSPRPGHRADGFDGPLAVAIARDDLGPGQRADRKILIPVKRARCIPTRREKSRVWLARPGGFGRVARFMWGKRSLRRRTARGSNPRGDDCRRNRGKGRAQGWSPNWATAIDRADTNRLFRLDVAPKMPILQGRRRGGYDLIRNLA